jgi:hypothetical protein
MHRLIENIKRETISNRWANKKGAQFEYEIEKNHYRLIEITPDLKSYIVGRTKRNDCNCPIIAKGIIAYLIRNWGKKEVDIYKSYYTLCFANFERIESKKPGSFIRNLGAEFYPLHISQEKEFATFSELIHPYLSKEEIELINQYVKAYFKCIERTYAPNETTEPVLSVPDWCIVFYYIDEAGEKIGNKKDRMEMFIENNNVVNPSGILTTKDSFKKEYHKIENRINGKHNTKPLPPERVENILPFLKNNKKALQTANNDIEHLSDQVE